MSNSGSIANYVSQSREKSTNKLVTVLADHLSMWRGQFSVSDCLSRTPYTHSHDCDVRRPPQSSWSIARSPSSMTHLLSGIMAELTTFTHSGANLCRMNSKTRYSLEGVGDNRCALRAGNRYQNVRETLADWAAKISRLYLILRAVCIMFRY